MATFAITDVAIVLNPADDVAIAKREIPAGSVLEDAGGRIEVRQDIRPGHKVARHAKSTGEKVRRYGQVIGFATADIAIGDHVHTQNLAVGDLHQEYEIGTDVRPVDFYPADKMRYFDGVLAVTHKSGCGTELFGEDHMALQRVLAGYAKHPNVAAYILIGLGCEV